MFIETGRALPNRVFVLRPETRRIRREAFVDQKQILIDCAELEFCIRDDDPALVRVFATTRINLQAQAFHALGYFVAQNLGTSLHVNVLVVTCFGFCRRRENWFGQSRRQLESGRQLNAANALRFPIFLPARTREITAHYTFHRQRLGFSHDHRTPGKLLAKWLQFLREFVEICCDKMVPDIVETFEPERGDLVEHRAFVRNRIG